MSYKHDTIPLESSEFPFDCFEATGLDKSDEVALHNHDCLELNYCSSGTGTYIIGEIEYDIKAGDLFVINNSDYHIAVNESDLNLKIIVFSPDMIWKNDDAFDSKYLQTFFQRKDKSKHRFTADMPMISDISKLFLETEREWMTRPEGFRLVIKALLLKILALLYRAFSLSESTSQKALKFQSDYNKIYSAISYIDNNFEHEIRLNHLAELSNFAPSYFSKIFNEVMATSVSNYINKKRVEHSCILLKESDLNICEIALKCGFNDISHFNKTFKSTEGISPKLYRKNS